MTSADRASARPRVGDRLPEIELPSARGGRRRSLRTGPRNALLLVVLPADFDTWYPDLRELATAAADIEYWYARIFVVIVGDEAAAARLADATGAKLVLADAGGEVARRLGVGGAAAVVIVADRYGQIYEITTAPPGAALPTAADLEAWAKFLATQCPECGVIDEPGHGEWALT